jgi:hypothetical protein
MYVNAISSYNCVVVYSILVDENIDVLVDLLNQVCSTIAEFGSKGVKRTISGNHDKYKTHKGP